MASDSPRINGVGSRHHPRSATSLDLGRVEVAGVQQVKRRLVARSHTRLARIHRSAGLRSAESVGGSVGGSSAGGWGCGWRSNVGAAAMGRPSSLGRAGRRVLRAAAIVPVGASGVLSRPVDG
jgi:hypothetical protein